ncbi:hypothetical protein J5N97_017774 [Dioscorea zingiberensis]|uniref:Leucine-rich repeat-containing N-terminal plant-type domain-containing protein n=1 Tax=Dioscorea zingiberensis TaxID=325984 RepID=A0A9D5CMM0_9LILI|nr:hypothetical protein J5N97_017774 [Dioscorea zingiberensis]
MATMFVLLLLVVQVVGLITSISCTTSTSSSAFGTPDLVPSTSTTTVCKEAERIALVEYKKQIIKDPSNMLSSWDQGRDCCSWEGVRCDNRTGNIVGLDLRCPYDLLCLGGEISPSLLRLQHLNHIDFSRNDFYGARIPSFISQFKELRYLNLSGTNFMGPIPTSLGNLSNLQTLDLSDNDFDPYNESSDHQWLSHLTSLQHFVMNGVNFGNSSRSLFLALNKLPSIKEISLSNCELESIPLSIPHLNFSTLSILDLFGNHINFSGCSWVFNLKTLEYLDLSFNLLQYPEFTTFLTYPFSFSGEIRGELNKMSISESIGSLCGLETLDLSWLNITQGLVELGVVFSGCLMDSLTHLHLRHAHLEGDIPDWMGDIKNLKVLDLSDNLLSGSVPSFLVRLSSSLEKLLLLKNELKGTIPKEIGELEELVHLDLSGNQLSGVVSEAHFAQLKKLEILDVSGNSLVFNVSSNWVPPFLLEELRIRSCSVGPGFPTWLRTQHKLNSLDMSYTGITGTIPDWFWNLTTHNLTSNLLLSHNQIEGMIPKSLNFTNMDYLDLSSNRFEGPLPEFHSSKFNSILDLSNNSFSGPIENISSGAQFEIYLSRNQLNGNVPSWLCQRNGLSVIDISENHLSGELPDCGVNSSIPKNLNLAYNNIFGSIPESICSDPISSVQSLQLNHNKLSGEFPHSLKNCSQLLVLDLSDNNFTGSIPFWVGVNLSNLFLLKLRSNSFIDHIPPEISQLKYLQILDLSNNNLSRSIPTSLGNFTAMQMSPMATGWVPLIIDSREAMPLSFRGRQDNYTNSDLSFVKSIDLSNNDLSGLIPEELASLYGLQSLNLSGNQLEGEIPNKLGRLKQLESLDLSINKLLGTIPSTFSNLTFLNHFNVSHNNLSGRIPSGNQFNTFVDPSIYIGNHLCGSPLIEKCTEDGGASRKGPSDQEDEDNEDNEMIWLYIGSLSGFAAGFWTVWGVLVFKKKWRHAYFSRTDNISDNIYVYVVVSLRRMKNKMMPNY